MEIESSGFGGELLVGYELDCWDRIVGVSEAWDAFALANDGASAIASKVVGRPVFSFIYGETTRLYFSVLLAGVRTSGHEAVRRYRCDSPSLRRYMEMRLVPLADGGVATWHRLLRTETRAPDLLFATSHGARFQRCSMCNRLRLAGSWVEPESVLKGRNPTRTLVAYGICDDCASLVTDGTTGLNG